MQFRPTATASRTGTLTVLDSAATSPQVITLSGTGTSLTGPTPISVDPGGLPCAAGVCDLGSSTPANDFYFASFSAAGDFTLPLTWTIANGSVPTGTALRPDGILYGVATSPTPTGRPGHRHSPPGSSPYPRPETRRASARRAPRTPS
ncbi:MAG: hypothetical protein QOF98_1840 [Streptomyces sp.]|nr:hypothetical protein [Streptomyces sp.]